MLWLSFLFLKLFSFTQIIGTHSIRRGKRSHERNRLLGLDSQRDMASAFEGFQSYIRVWWVGTVFAVHQLPNVSFRKVICGGPSGYLHHAVDVTEIPCLFWACWCVPPDPWRDPSPGPKSSIAVLALITVWHGLSFQLLILEQTEGRLASLRMNT